MEVSQRSRNRARLVSESLVMLDSLSFSLSQHLEPTEAAVAQTAIAAPVLEEQMPRVCHVARIAVHLDLVLVLEDAMQLGYHVAGMVDRVARECSVVYLHRLTMAEEEGT